MSHMEPLRLSSAEAIRRAAIELFSADPSTSLAAVAARAGVGRATLHRHFASREDLIRDLAIAALDATDEATANLGLEASRADAPAAAAQMFERLVPLADQFHFLARCTVDDPEVERRYAAQVEGLRVLVDDLRAQGHVAEDVPDAWAMALADQLIWTAWSAADAGVDHADAARLATRTFLRGIGPADAARDPERTGGPR